MPKRKPYCQQKFRKEWLTDSQLKEWLTEEKKTAEGETVLSCKFCHCVLSPKLCDLKDHAKTKNIK